MVRQVFGNKTVKSLAGELGEATHDVVQFPFILNEMRSVEVVSQLDGAGTAIIRKKSGEDKAYQPFSIHQRKTHLYSRSVIFSCGLSIKLSKTQRAYKHY